MKIAKKFNKEVILDIDYRPNLWEMGKHNEGESRFKKIFQSQIISKIFFLIAH